MLRRSRALAATVLAVVALAVPAPASAVDAADPVVAHCRADVGFSSDEWYQTVYVTGAMAPVGATHVWLTCGVVRHGETVAYVGEDVDFSAAVVAGTATVLAGPISICYEATVLYSERYEYFDTCP